MENLLDIDWRSMFVPTESVLEIIIRGTIMYVGMFVLLRVFRRQAGTLGMADLLVIVVIADAAQNGMAGDSRSITEAMILISTIVAWDWMFDWLGYKSNIIGKILEPQPLVVIKNGRVIKEHLDQEMITRDDLMSQLRQQGIQNISEVREGCLESNGKFSFLKYESEPNEGNKTGDSPVNR